jgi:hypothetical protein
MQTGPQYSQPEILLDETGPTIAAQGLCALSLLVETIIQPFSETAGLFLPAGRALFIFEQHT